MSGRLIAGTYTTGVTLADPADNPVTVGVGAYLGNAAGAALYGSGSTYWSITNYGLVQNSGTSAANSGIVVQDAGAIANAQSGTVNGYGIGVLIPQTGTVINRGHISSNATAGHGFYYSTASGFIALSGGVIMGGGGVSNVAGATITSYFEGVAIARQGSVANAGTIVGTSTKYGFGIVLTAGGSISDAATGVIAGGRYGILALGNAAATVTNDGVISGQTKFGIELTSGGSVINSTGAAITGGSYGVLAAGTAGSTVTNAGTIIGTSIVGVFLPVGGVATNTGTMTGGYAGLFAAGTIASSVANSGLATGKYFGIKLTKLAGTVQNSGTAFSTAVFTNASGFDAAGIDLAAGGVVTNGVTGNVRATWKGVEIGTVTTNVGGTVLNQGFIYASNSNGSTGAAVWVHGPAVISNASTGTIAGGPFGIVLYNQATVTNRGSIGGSEYAVFQANAGYAVNVITSPGAIFSGAVQGSKSGSTIRGTLELTTGPSAGTIAAFGSKYTGFGEVLLDGGAAWSFGGTVTASQTVAFGGNGAKLTLATPRAMAGIIAGFSISDTIGLAGITDVTGVTLTAGNSLTITESTGPGLTLHFDPAQSFAGEQFGFNVSGAGTNLILAPPCFAAGTRISTPDGMVAVERLRAGDDVDTVSGGRQTIRWIGHRRVDCRRHPDQRRVWPIRIAPHAFGANRPARALWLSPDHSVFVEDVLIPIRFLVNGSTVAQVAVDSITYYHIELPRHDVVFAEGMPAETYLETGERNAFENADGVMQLHPDFAPPQDRAALIWASAGYAPLLGENGEFERARQKLAWQAQMLAGRRMAS